MRTYFMAAAIAFVNAVALPAVAADDAKSKAEQRSAIRKEAQATLAKLYKVHPSSKAAIQKAAGYAAFDNVGINLFVLSTARGKGIVVERASKKETYMKMLSGGVGIGLGAKDFRAVFVFENTKALQNFVNSGWDADAHADATAKGAGKGGSFDGAVSVSPGVWVYQITETGLAAQVTLQGTKYYKDSDLN